MICPNCILTNVNSGSCILCSPKAIKEIVRAFGKTCPVTDNVGEPTPSPYLAVKRREYLPFATPQIGFCKLLQVPSNVR